MMEGKAGVSMESKKKMSRAKSNSPMKRTVRRAVAWLLVFCMCMANMNSAVYAAEIATSSDALMAATPSDATATDSNAAEILMPEETVSGEELKEEAIRAISAGHEFDFDSEIRVVKDAEGKNESYSELFKGYRSFTLFADNGNGGRLTGGNDNAYGYIVVRVDKDAYEAFEKEEGTARATGSDAIGSSAAERVWSLTGDEELIFLYVNADNGTVTFSLNIENLEADDIVVPSRTELYEDTEEEAEETSPAEKPAEDANEAGGSGSGGGSGSSSGSSGDVQDDPTDEGASDDSQAEDGQTDDSQNENDSENDTDAEKPDEKPEDGQTGGGSDSGQENNGSSNTDKEDGNTDSGNDGNSGSGSENAGDSGNADSNGGNSGSGSGSDNGKDEGGSSNQGSSSDKGDSHQGGSDSNSGSDSGNAGNSGNSGSGSSDKGNSGSSSDKGGSDSDSAKLSKSSLNLPTVMGPNPNAEFEEDEFGDMSFDEWQEMMEEEEEEAEEDEEDYTEEVSVAYDSEDEGISYLNMTMLPAVGAVVKKTEQTKGLAKLFKSSRSGEAEAVVMAGVVPLSGIVPAEGTYYKQIEQNADGSYRLHLGVTGGEQQGLDIVLAIDLSGSMNDKIGYDKTRLEALKETLGYKEGRKEKNGFIDDLFAQSPNSRFSVVTYSYDSAVELGWTELGNTGSGKTRIKETIGGLKADGGTNYEAGLYKTIETLKERGNSSNIPVVIFLSDGKPTYYYDPVNEFNEAGEESGKGSKIDENTGDGTIFAAGKFHDEMEKMNGSIYTVGFGIPKLHWEGDSDKNDYAQYQPEQYLYAISQGLTWETGGDGKLIAPKNNDGTTLETGGADAQGLKDAFADILSNLKMENVTISDQLSEFVTFKGDTAGASNVKVQTFRKNQSGELVLQNELQEGRDYESLEFNSETGTIKLIFGKDKKLESGVIYELSFDIQVKDGVEIQPEDKVTGDPNTDYGKGQISSGKPGVRTNTEGYFTFGEDGTTKIYYPHPVIPASATYTPGHQKYIRDNGDGTYDLTLNVTSTKESSEDTHTESVPADVIFIMDKSKSMGYSMNYDGTVLEWEKTRAAALNNAMDKILGKLTPIKEVSFGSYRFAGTTGSFSGWKTEQDAYNLKFKDNNWWQFESSTNPSGALKKAAETMSQRPKEHKKYFIFLTDGEPTGGEELSKTYAAEYPTKVPESKFYAVSITNNTSTKFMQAIVRNANGLSNGEPLDHYLFQANDQEGLNQALESIADEIVNEVTNSTPGVTNVTITDTLSKYAEFAFDTSNLGNVRVTRKTADGTETELQKDEYRVNIREKTIAVSLMNVNDEEGKKNELEKDVTYSITFQVKPSQEAKDAYQQDGGYHHNPDGSYTEGEYTGAEGTDDPNLAEEQQTSSNKPGFPSNEKATLSYEYDGTKGNLTYKHPVLQVPQTGQFVVQKLVEIDDNETPLAGSPDQEFIIQIQEQTEDGTNGFKSSVSLKDGEMTGTVITEGEKTFNVHEIVPMEYEQSSIVVYENDGNGNPKPEIARVVAEDGNFKVLPGQNLIVRVTNTPVHKDFFHDAFSVTNKTKGDASTPFSNDLAEQAAKTASRLGLTKKKTELEQEEGDLIA